MNKENNEVDSQEDIKSISHKDNGEDPMSSVRRKYQKGKKDTNIVLSQKFEKSEDIPNLVQKEEIITYQKEITKTIEDDYSSNEGESSLVKKNKEEKKIPGKIVTNLKQDLVDTKKEEIVVEEHSKIQKEIESKENEIMKDLEKHLDLKDIILGSDKKTGKENPNEVQESTYVKKTIEIISTTSTDGKLIGDGNKDINSKNKNEVTTFTKTSLVNQINEDSKPEIKEKINTTENFTNNEEKTSKITIIKKENSSLLNQNDKKPDKKEENQDIKSQKEIFSKIKVTKTTEKTEENVGSKFSQPKPKIEFKKNTKIATNTLDIKTEPIIPKPQTQKTEVNKLKEIITKKRQTQNQIIDKGLHTPSQIIFKGRQTPNLMINTGRQTHSHIVNTGRQTPNQYSFSKITTTTTSVIDNPISSILNRKNKDIIGSSSTTITSRRNKNIVSSLPKIDESNEKRRQLASNQTTSVLTNIKRIEPFNIKNEKYDFNKVTITNESHLRSEKSTPALRGGVTKSIVEIRKPLNTISQAPELLNNLSTLTISDTGKKPKRQYVLNTRNTEIIKPRNRIKLLYKNNPNNRDFISTDFNLKSKIVKNCSKEHNNSTYLPNTVYHEINETKKHGKKEVHVSPRKLWVIKTERKPNKLTYTVSNTDQPLFRNSIQTTTSSITENKKSNISGRNSIPESSYNSNTYKLLKTNYLTSLNDKGSKNIYTKSKYEPISHKSKYETNTTITTKFNELRSARNKNKERIIPLTAGNSKTRTIETTVTSRNNRNERRLNRITNDLGNKNNLNSNKIISIKTSKVISDSGINKDKDINKGDYNIIKNEQKITKIVIEGSSSSVLNSGPKSLTTRLVKDIELGNNDKNTLGLIKKQDSSSIITKEITIENNDGSATQVKESRFVRISKNEE